jgi:hypothetical protein
VTATGRPLSQPGSSLSSTGSAGRRPESYRTRAAGTSGLVKRTHRERHPQARHAQLPARGAPEVCIMAPNHDAPEPQRGHGLSVTLDAEGRRRRARLAVTTRHHPDRPDLTLEDRRYLKAHAAEHYIRELVDGLPPLTDGQRARLAALLHPGADDAGTT